jgi:metal-responsive CopG/Arc/MetJ family transcriptional regulator
MERARPNTRLVAITIAPALIEAIDEVAKRQFRSRSAVIRQAVLHELEKEGVCPFAA